MFKFWQTHSVFMLLYAWKDSLLLELDLLRDELGVLFLVEPSLELVSNLLQALHQNLVRLFFECVLLRCGFERFNRLGFVQTCS